MSVVSMKQLLEAGVHFGHQTQRWNPKMKKFIFIKRNGIHILDLNQTVQKIHLAYDFVKSVAQKGENILFVGTKKQAKESVKEAAQKCEAFYVNNRWYGGMLTNMKTIRESISKLDKFDSMVEDGSVNNYTKFEIGKMQKNYDKKIKSLGGVRKMDRLPGVIIISDTNNDDIAIKEAAKKNIPIVAIVDTNSDPDPISFPIPSNDDAIRAIALIFDVMANAVIEGRRILTEGEDTQEQTINETQEDLAKSEENTPLESSKKPLEPVENTKAEEKKIVKKEKAVEKKVPKKSKAKPVSEKKVPKKSEAKPVSKKKATKKVIAKTKKPKVVKKNESEKKADQELGQ